MVVLLAVGVCERVQFSQEQRVFQHSLDGFDQVRLQRGRMLLFRVALVQKRLEGHICFCWRGHKHRKMWLCCHSTDSDRTIWRRAAFVMLFTIQRKMFSSTLSSLTYWKTLLHNHHKSAESTLNNKNSQREEADQPHRHPHTAAGLYYTPEPLTWDLQTPRCWALWKSQNWQAARSPLSWDLRTFDQHFGHFGVAGTESAVDLEAVGIIQERAAQRKEDFL